jgi:hypothetical protein
MTYAEKYQQYLSMSMLSMVMAMVGVLVIEWRIWDISFVWILCAVIMSSALPQQPAPINQKWGSSYLEHVMSEINYS